MSSRTWLSPSARGMLQLSIQVVLALALFVVLQFLAFRHNHRFDLTPTKVFSLSPQAEQVAAHFKQPATITVFFNSQQTDERRAMLDLLEQFQSAAPSISFRLYDLDRSPALAKKYGVSSYNTGVLESGDRVLPLRSIDEEEIANALLQVSRRRRQQLCFLTGHGERNPANSDDREGYSEVAKSLERENFAIQISSTLPREGVPKQCDVVILAGPSHDLLPGEAESLERYLHEGGRVLLLADPDAPPSVLAFLRANGIDAGNDLIVDEGNRFIGADSFMPQVLRFRSDVFRNHLDAPAVLSLARTIRPIPDTAGPASITSIAATSPDSWAMMGVTTPPDGAVQFRRGTDQPGPLSVGVLVVYPAAGEAHHASAGGAPEEDHARHGKLMVFGDSDFATNFYLNLLGNKDLFMSSVAVLAEDPTLIAMRRKGLMRGTLSPIVLTAHQARMIFWSAVVAQPAFFLVIGGAAAFLRRRHWGGR
jgi:gliding motility-associatede transport system auxiliary component